jgi:hypothetical protein
MAQMNQLKDEIYRKAEKDELNRKEEQAERRAESKNLQSVLEKILMALDK